MDINLQIRFSSELHSWLCFKHAVKLASEGTDIATDIDNYSSEYYMGCTYCRLCGEEEDKIREDQISAVRKFKQSIVTSKETPREV